MSELLVAPADGVTTLTLNRPAARNALTATLLADLRGALDAACRDDATRVVVLTGAGEKAFCAGADLTAMGAGAGMLEGHAARRRYLECIEALWFLPKPTLAAVNGAALAGGLGLVLACDLAVAADTATFGTPEVGVGLMPMMVMALLQRHLGRKKALELVYTGDRLDAAEALRLGLVNAVVPAAELPAAAAALAARLAAQSPAALRLGKEAFQTAADLEFTKALRHLLSMLDLIAGTEDAAEGVSAFLEKRPPRWKGR